LYTGLPYDLSISDRQELYAKEAKLSAKLQVLQVISNKKETSTHIGNAVFGKNSANTFFDVCLEESTPYPSPGAKPSELRVGAEILQNITRTCSQASF
jgi:hypothetical protein